jgi:Mg-chelatase subunit ChlD
VAFNVLPTVVVDLTPDRAAARGALDRLPRDEGSRIDLAVLEGVHVLTAAASADHLPIIVLITDGKQVGAPREAALDAGAAARLAGITVFTVGFGSDIDPDLLVRIAGDPARFFNAPGPGDLLGVFRAIGGALPCNPER